MLNRTFGLVPSPQDPRDWSASKFLGASPIPESCTNLLPLVSIRDQGNTNSCVWFSVSQATRVSLKNKGDENDLWFSPLFGYWNTRKEGQTTVTTDGGCDPRTAMKVYQTIGFCREEDWPFDESKVNQMPAWNAYRAAYDQRLMGAYHRVDTEGKDRILELKRGLSMGHPIIYGSGVDDAYTRNTGEVIHSLQGEFRGNHMRCLVGYENGYFIEANSWGKTWGNNGFGHIAEEVMTWSGSFEFWIFETVPPAPPVLAR